MSKGTKKDLIADVALSCFLASGYSKTTVDEIVRVSGVSKGGIYWYFASKEDIFWYLVERWFADWMAEFKKITEENVSTVQKVTQYCEHFMKRIDASIFMLFVEFLLQANSQEAIDKMTKYYSQALAMQAAEFEAAFARGELRALDPKLTAYVLSSILDGIGRHWLIFKDKEVLAKTCQTALDIFLHGVLNKQK
ncbi:TetR/AcrR family transcriptional regulator [Bacillota bacterium LX-D]|nr:TetR/AcrR family transcriptional regulator [Bacillota bacterium LX-D]